MLTSESSCAYPGFTSQPKTLLPHYESLLACHCSSLHKESPDILSVIMSTADEQADSQVEQGKAPTDTLSNETSTDRNNTSYTGMATSAAGSAAETASNAAAGVKDTMFSMFGGGGKKEVKEEKTLADEEDRSGSSKAVKEKEKEKEAMKEGGDAEEGVCTFIPFTAAVESLAMLY